jgi:hypothetical protein
MNWRWETGGGVFPIALPPLRPERSAYGLAGRSGGRAIGNTKSQEEIESRSRDSGSEH